MKRFITSYIWLTLCSIVIAVLMLVTRFETLNHDFSLIEYIGTLFTNMTSGGILANPTSALIYGISLLLAVMALIGIISGTILSLIIIAVYSIGSKMSKKAQKELPPKLDAFPILAPLFAFGSIWIPKIYNTIVHGVSLEFVTYTRGFDFFIVFVVVGVIHWIGSTAINFFIKEWQ